MWSVCNRRRLSSQALQMWYAERRRSFGPVPIGWYTLVARTIRSRRPPWARPPPDDLLGDAVALLHVRGLGAPVHVRGVEVVDPLLQRLVHDLEAGGLVRHPASLPAFTIQSNRLSIVTKSGTGGVKRKFSGRDTAFHIIRTLFRHERAALPNSCPGLLQRRQIVTIHPRRRDDCNGS